MAKNLKVTWTKSAIGYNQKQKEILKALGFKKLNQSKVLPDNESIRGSLFHVKHLVNVEEIS
ncbi:MAG: 50S ribosomal protein L30 [Clostridia bacterium]|jgi:large subunit ribosomal protein L30|nr:50S ribosomal protein L30 [Clostridia bacterium]MDD3231852.1 50S ribosomal protein L30 [Clostridia bacterium]MDD3862497.1 50S ribosomal protein L30 [Clostridia bacterium]MDD4408455.1 50S ribosomal protein L30 [Clostridia bacterium]